MKDTIEELLEELDELLEDVQVIRIFVKILGFFGVVLLLITSFLAIPFLLFSNWHDTLKLLQLDTFADYIPLGVLISLSLSVGIILRVWAAKMETKITRKKRILLN